MKKLGLDETNVWKDVTDPRKKDILKFWCHRTGNLIDNLYRTGCNETELRRLEKI